MLRLKVVVLSLMVVSIWIMQLAFFLVCGLWLLLVTDVQVQSLIGLGLYGFLEGKPAFDQRPFVFSWGAAWTFVFAVACLLARGATRGRGFFLKWLTGLVVALAMSLWLHGYDISATALNIKVRDEWYGMPQTPRGIALAGVAAAFILIPLQTWLTRRWRRAGHEAEEVASWNEPVKTSRPRGIRWLIPIALLAAIAVRDCLPFDYPAMNASRMTVVGLQAIGAMLVLEMVVAGWLMPLAVKRKRYSFPLAGNVLAGVVALAFAITGQPVRANMLRESELSLFSLGGSFFMAGFVLLLIVNRIPLEWLLEARRQQRLCRQAHILIVVAGPDEEVDQGPVALGARFWLGGGFCGLAALALLSISPFYRDPLISGHALLSSNPEAQMTAVARGWESQSRRAISRIKQLVETGDEASGNTGEVRARWSRRFEEIFARPDLSEETGASFAIVVGDWTIEAGRWIDQYLDTSEPPTWHSILIARILGRTDIDEQVWPRITRFLQHSKAEYFAQPWLVVRRSDARSLSVVRELRESDRRWEPAWLVVWGLQAADPEVREVLDSLPRVNEANRDDRTAEQFQSNRRLRALSRGYLESGRQDQRSAMLTVWVHTMTWEFGDVDDYYYSSLDPFILLIKQGHLTWQELEPYHDGLLSKLATSIHRGNEFDHRRAALLLSLGCGSIEELRQFRPGHADVETYEADLSMVEKYIGDGKMSIWYGPEWEKSVPWR